MNTKQSMYVYCIVLYYSTLHYKIVLMYCMTGIYKKKKELNIKSIHQKTFRRTFGLVLVCGIV